MLDDFAMHYSIIIVINKIPMFINGFGYQHFATSTFATRYVFIVLAPEMKRIK